MLCVELLSVWKESTGRHCGPRPGSVEGVDEIDSRARRGTSSVPVGRRRCERM
jgi:hypothetical protein